MLTTFDHLCVPTIKTVHISSLYLDSRQSTLPRSTISQSLFRFSSNLSALHPIPPTVYFLPTLQYYSYSSTELSLRYFRSLSFCFLLIFSPIRIAAYAKTRSFRRSLYSSHSFFPPPPPPFNSYSRWNAFWKLVGSPLFFSPIVCPFCLNCYCRFS